MFTAIVSPGHRAIKALVEECEAHSARGEHGEEHPIHRVEPARIANRSHEQLRTVERQYIQNVDRLEQRGEAFLLFALELTPRRRNDGRASGEQEQAEIDVVAGLEIAAKNPEQHPEESTSNRG